MTALLVLYAFGLGFVLAAVLDAVQEHPRPSSAALGVLVLVALIALWPVTVPVALCLGTDEEGTL